MADAARNLPPHPEMRRESASAPPASPGERPQRLVDPAVSRAKFEREVARFRSGESAQRARGVLLLRVEYPVVLVAFAAPHLRPAPVVFGARFDFTDYDLLPPSVRLVNPFNGAPYRQAELPTPLPRHVGEERAEGGPVQPPQALMQAHAPLDIPFLCLPGVREYHEHPAHTGDSWLLHRARGEGTLGFLVDQLHKYGIEGLGGFLFNVQVSAKAVQVNYDLTRIPR